MKVNQTIISDNLTIPFREAKKQYVSAHRLWKNGEISDAQLETYTSAVWDEYETLKRKLLAMSIMKEEVTEILDTLDRNTNGDMP